ncbi:20 kDa chaperonin, chloroplastic [Spinacia oleracea]|uniref:20 kDa chaperonin, chloroplastic n=2 Tax=Spinacia oleracea TaxID=3562 RepID=CH10C_SPIOL|nr:20 kDa chaperonin, chloroplastic [Spinacia oleracea]Q02073.1 RecName: Full=20 kDa chaperonin, chloroplastic; AltName: Full=Chaperonin 10; Short=Ch-CPN10; Short=Cpn10; AltName: Full=Protein Cpn21; Flags: Precursor [Spinacia oleracea]AAB59307.1 chaperonin 10 [Spinacia oleracea]
MAATHLTSTSSLTINTLPSFEGLRSASGISKINVSVAYPSFTSRSFRGLVVRAASITTSKYTSVKPLGDRVLIKTKIVEEKTTSGIFLPTAAQKKPQSGEVVAIGSGKKVGDKKLPVAVKTGAEVVYSKYTGTEIEVDGSSHLIVKEDDIIGILETDDVKDLKPLNDRLLIKVAEVENKTSGGLLLAESSKEKPSFGTVVATGPGVLDEEGNRIPLPVCSGNTVLYSKYAGNDFKGVDGSDYMVLRVSDVMAVLS